MTNIFHISPVNAQISCIVPPWLEDPDPEIGLPVVPDPIDDEWAILPIDDASRAAAMLRA